MREKRGLMLDPVAIERVRTAENLGEHVGDAAVVRYALALVGGLPVADALDATPGRGSITHRQRRASSEGGRAA